jgi:hypothetical protein
MIALLLVLIALLILWPAIAVSKLFLIVVVALLLFAVFAWHPWGGPRV